MKRDQSIDALRALAIYLVVLGHFVQSTIIDYDNNLLFKFIYSFHMPLFVFISGYLTYRDENLSLKFIKSRFNSLLLPYFSWMVISTIVFSIKNEDNFGEFILKSFLYPDNGLWYLWVLYFMHILYYLSKKIKKINELFSMFILSVLALLISFVFNIGNIFAFKTLAFLLPYYILGLLANKNQNLFIKTYKTWLIILPFFLILVYYWRRIDAIEINYKYSNSTVFIYIYKSIVALMGVVISVGMIKTINKFNDTILFVGKNTLPIYAMNFYFLYIIEPIKDFFLGSFYYLNAFILSFFIIIFCLLIYSMLNKNKLISLLFFGQRKK